MCLILPHRHVTVLLVEPIGFELVPAEPNSGRRISIKHGIWCMPHCVRGGKGGNGGLQPQTKYQDPVPTWAKPITTHAQGEKNRAVEEGVKDHESELTALAVNHISMPLTATLPPNSVLQPFWF